MLKYGKWSVEVLPRDGGRLGRLAYGGQDLLTAPPRVFRVPRRNFGSYETRPVYGYDDCFPTVDQCSYPFGNVKVPDHGELWRLPAKCTTFNKGLKCVFVSRIWPFIFERKLVFNGSRLSWIFTVSNNARKPLPFIHVMHPLMPLSRVAAVELPFFKEAVDEVTGKKLALTDFTRQANTAWMRNAHGSPGRFALPVRNMAEIGRAKPPWPTEAALAELGQAERRGPAEPLCYAEASGNDTEEKRGGSSRKMPVNNVGAVDVEKYLLSLQTGEARMLLLRGVKKGFFRIGFRGGIRLAVTFNRALFPTVGIWWNNRGYPDEKDIARAECAFEPIPGPWSSLMRSYREGQCLSAPAMGEFSWRIDWRMEE